MACWDRECDLLVIGGGGAGLAAALVPATEGLRTLLCEKSERLGGTTATSGGTIWVPGTSQSERAGAPDTVAAARIYLDGEVGSDVPRDIRETFFATGREAIDYFEARSSVHFRANNPYPDYHAEREGGAFGGRALTPLEFDGRLPESGRDRPLSSDWSAGGLYDAGRVRRDQQE